MAGDGEGLCKKVGKIFLAGDKEDAELVLIDTSDHVANGTACPKILTSLDRRFDWLGQLRPRCRKK